MSTRFIVGYRDNPKARPLYFGTFVSETMADKFIEALPTPLEGGWVRPVQLQPFSAHEVRTVAEIIERKRNRQFA